MIGSVFIRQREITWHILHVEHEWTEHDSKYKRHEWAVDAIRP